MRVWDLFKKLFGRITPEYNTESIPLYRTYGVWRRAHPVMDRVLFYALRVAVIFVLAVLGIAFFAAIFSLLMYGSVLIAAVFLILVVSVVLFIVTKVPRKRLSFYRKLKKLCKKEKFRLRIGRSVWRSFVWSSTEPDFILSAGMCDYYAHFLTVRKYNSTLTMKNANEMERISYPLDNRFTLIFEFKPHAKTYSTDFKPIGEVNGKRSVRAVIVNPVCKEMYERDKDGSTVATGSGFSRFGYTLYTASGFIESVNREAHSSAYKEESKRNLAY